MPRLVGKARRSGRATESLGPLIRTLPLVVLLLLLLQELVAAEGKSTDAHLPSAEPQRRRAREGPTRGGEAEEIRELGKWNGLAVCIRDSKEERALERWLFCVEAVRSRELTGSALFSWGQGEAIQLSPDGRSDGNVNWSMPERVGTREARWHDLVESHTPELPRDSEEFGGRVQFLHATQEGFQGDVLSDFCGMDWSESTVQSAAECTESVGSERKNSEDLNKIGRENGRAENLLGLSITAKGGVGIHAAGDEKSSSDESSLIDVGKGFVSNGREDGPRILPGVEIFEKYDVPQDRDNPIHGADSSLESSDLGFHSSQDRLGSEDDRSSVRNLPVNFEVGYAVTSAAIVGLLTMVLRGRRGRESESSEISPKTSNSRTTCMVERSTEPKTQETSSDVNKLSEALAMAVATVFYEVLDENGFHANAPFSAEELSKLLEVAMKESLTPVLGNDRVDFVENFKNSFTSTYRTIRSVRHVYPVTTGRETIPRHTSSKSKRGSPAKYSRGSLNEMHPEIVNSNDGAVNELRSRRARVRCELKNTTYGDEDMVAESHSEENSFLTTRNSEPAGWSNFVGSNFSNVSIGSMQAKLSKLKSANTEVEVSHIEDDKSPNEEMYSAESSSGSDEWMVLSGDEKFSESIGESEMFDFSWSVGPGTPENEEHGWEKRTVEQGRNTFTSSVTLQKQPFAGKVPTGFRSSMHNKGEVGSSGSQGKSSVCESLQEDFGFGHLMESSCEANQKDSLEVNVPNSLLKSASTHAASGSTNDESRDSSLWTSEHRLSLRRNHRGLASRTSSRNHVRLNDGNRIQRVPEHLLRDMVHLSGISMPDTLVYAPSTLLDYGAAPEESYRNALLQRSVEAQECHNYLKSLELSHGMKRLIMKEDHLHLQSESNSLMRDNVDLSRTKVEFKESEFQDRKLTAGCYELRRMCADELVAGLCVMLMALGFGAWKFSYAQLSKMITVCQPPPVRSSQRTSWVGSNWMYKSLTDFSHQIQALSCELTKAGRMLAGLFIIAVVTFSLLRRSVTSSSQAMPATIIVIVLGGICGFAGKISIDSLGGSGLHWVVPWECLCFLQAFATCFTPQLYQILNGPMSRTYHEETPFWSRMSATIFRFAFHTILVIVLPLTAGLLPFASPEDILQMCSDLWSPDRSINLLVTVP